MGEALISRAGGGEGEVQLPIAPGYHTIGVRLKDQTGKVVVNWPIQCKDGTATYNYKTNEKGMTIFMCNSGAANISINNYLDGIQYIDIAAPGWTNIDAPVGLTTTLNINFTDGPNKHDFTSNKLFGLLLERNCNLYIVGGGGGGGPAGHSSGEKYWAGGGGGAGYLNNYTNQQLYGIYNFISGLGGSGSYGNTGGTSYIVNTNYSAIGGKGGNHGIGRQNGGIGGLGNGGSALDSGPYGCDATHPTSSYVDFAGGGGTSGMVYMNQDRADDRMTIPKRGNPDGGYYGWTVPGYNMGDTFNTDRYDATPLNISPSRGGGGSGGYQSGQTIYSAQTGGRGMMRITIQYD